MPEVVIREAFGQAVDVLANVRRFWPGTEPPPPGDVVYIPSPNDVARFYESTGQWVEKNPFREI